MSRLPISNPIQFEIVNHVMITVKIVFIKKLGKYFMAMIVDDLLPKPKTWLLFYAPL